MKSVARNYLYSVFYQILITVLPLVTTPYISRVLGANGVGIYSYTLSVASYFIMFGSLGILLYGQRQIAFVQSNFSARSRVFFEVLAVRFLSLGFAAVVYALCFTVKGEYAAYYRILLIYIISNAFDITFFFQGMEDFKKMIGRNLIARLVSLVCIFLFVKKATDVSTYLLVFTFANLVGNISMWFYLPIYIEIPPLSQLNIIKHITPVFSLFIPQIATQFYNGLDKVMLGTMLADKAQVGYYEQSSKIVLIFLNVVTAIGTVMMPNIAKKYAQKNRREIIESLKNSFGIIFMMTFPMIFGLCAVCPDLIPKFLGQGFTGAVMPTYIISPTILLVGLSNVIGVQYLLPTMRQKYYSISVISGAAVNIFLNFLLIPRYKAVGTAVGMLAAELTVTVCQFYFIRRKISVGKILSSGVKYFVSALVMFTIIMILNKTVLTSQLELLRIMWDVAAGVFVYMFILFVTKDKVLFRAVHYVRHGEE